MTKTGGMLLAALAVSGGNAALAQDEGIVGRARDRLTARPLTLEVGGGVANTTQGGAQDFTDPGAMWTVRGIWGAASAVAVEAAYVGSSQRVENLGVGDASLVRNGLEALVRVGRPFTLGRPGTYVLPYGTAGIGWAFFNVAGEQNPPPGLRDNDNVLTTPVGLGVAGGAGPLSLDLRFMFRPVYRDDMFRALETGSEVAGLNQFTVSAAVGYTF